MNEQNPNKLNDESLKKVSGGEDFSYTAEIPDIWADYHGGLETITLCHHCGAQLDMSKIEITDETSEQYIICPSCKKIIGLAN